MTASPVASRSSVPVTTSPVLTPIRPSKPELRQRVTHLDRRPHRAQCVVLVHHRHAEDGHHGVADELLDGAAVALDDRLHPLEVAGEQRAEPLGVDRLAERGRAGDVAEEDRDRLSLLVGEVRVLVDSAPHSGQNLNARSDSKPQRAHVGTWQV